jgi:hypothetical protein
MIGFAVVRWPMMDESPLICAQPDFAILSTRCLLGLPKLPAAARGAAIGNNQADGLAISA